MVLCPSEATRKLVVENFAIDPHKTAVTHEGIAEVFFAKPASPTEHSVTPARPYLLFVGTWEARKGIRTLLEACRRVNSSGARVDLVLAGKPGWRMGEMLDALRGEPNVTLIERPSDDQLARLYRSALALVYPSEMEGFGLPVAEAMACGCPVIATDLPSIREFAGDCPLYIRAGDSGALARHVGDLLAGGPQLDARREAGRGAVAWLRWREIGEHAATLIENA
jgi:glycosyltransferase involved in cell wall biosynthesis